VKLLTSALLALALSGCVASGTQVSEQAAMQFKEGITTEDQIVAKLGQPTAVHNFSGNRILSYSGMQVRMKGTSFIPVVGMFAGGSDYKMTIANFHIGKNGVLEKIDYSGSGAGSRMGANPGEMETKDPTAVK
jgi:outer membrane protein assembly factor BamE (lipoprotein component of BamABCDE complex)